MSLIDLYIECLVPSCWAMWEVSWLALIVNLTQPRITWGEILNEGLSRLEEPWECLWEIVLLIDRRIQPTMGSTIS